MHNIKALWKHEIYNLFHFKYQLYLIRFFFFCLKETFLKYILPDKSLQAVMNELFIAGHPQVIKVVQSTPNKALSGIVSTTNAGGLKVFKAPNQESQVLA